MRSSKLFATLAIVGLLGCDDEVGPAEVETFSADLTGAAERPTPVTTTASGSATLSLVGPALLYRIDVTGITNVTAAHIHGPATAEQFTGVRVNLCGAGDTPACISGTGVLVSGVATQVSGISFDSLVVLLRNGNAYVNVHTTANAGGEIRGQITAP